jgi:hypothetical protein
MCILTNLMEPPLPMQSRLILRLALAISDSGYPVSAWRRRGQRGPTNDKREGTRGTAPDQGAEEKFSIPESTWEHLESFRLRFVSELSFADSYLAEDPPLCRIQLLLANSSELRKVALLQRYIERAYSYRLHHPEDGLEISDSLIAWTRTDTSPLVAVIRRRALMERGNFLRILGDPAGAYTALAKVSTELETNGTSDPLEEARYQEVLGSLEKDCGNFEASNRLMRKALTKVRKWGDYHTLQRVLIATGASEILNRKFEQGDKHLEEAMQIEGPDSFFLRCAALNRLLGYYLSGNSHKAYQALLRVRDKLGESWLKGAPEGWQMRALWIEGQILKALQSDDDAVGVLKKAREFAIRLGLGCEVCHVSIDLAQVYATRERFSEVRRELAFGIPFCSERRALDVHGKQALELLQGSLQHQGRLEISQIRAVALQLESFLRAPLQPSLQLPSASLQL